MITKKEKKKTANSTNPNQSTIRAKKQNRTMTMQLMETHRRKPSFTWSDVAFAVVTVRAQRSRAQRTSRWWLICEYHRTHSEKIHRRKKELLNMLFFFFSPWVGYNHQWQHSNKLRSHFLQLRNCIAFLLFIKCVKAEITYFFRVLLFFFPLPIFGSMLMIQDGDTTTDSS